MNQLKLELTVDEVNVVLDALGNLPLKQVAALFEKVKAQAMAQLEEQKVES
jgi:hypothetical protein